MASAEGIPTLKMLRMLAFAGSSLTFPPLRMESGPSPRIAIRKYPHEMIFDRQVASPAPRISLPRGSSTNMNSGSNATFSRPPRVIPTPAFFDSPILLRRLAYVLESTVGMPPSTITQNAYSLAYRYVSLPAPKNDRIGRRKNNRIRENIPASPTAIQTLKLLTLLASCI